MSEEEIRRAGGLEWIAKGELKQSQAAELLSVSYRQLKRLYRWDQVGGAVGLVHGSAGKRSTQATPDKDCQHAL